MVSLACRLPVKCEYVLSTRELRTWSAVDVARSGYTTQRFVYIAYLLLNYCKGFS